VLAAGLAARGGPAARRAVLLVASLTFYGWGDPVAILLLLAVGLGAWVAALGLGHLPRSTARLLGALVTLGPLVAVKAVDALGIVHTEATGGAWLPAGVSFYALQAWAYVADVDRGRVQARTRPADVLLFLAFFPQLVAGPIERADRLLPQLDAPARLTREAAATAVSLGLWGAFQKLVVADGLAPFVDRVFAAPTPSWPLVVAASVGFAVQILADFSGYTNLARGSARLLGVELVENFRHPYLAASPRDFWRRWHVSLGAWIRDHVYVPLGGDRAGPARFVLATVVALGVSGLWHGPGVTYLVWAGWHAALLVAQRALTPWIPPSWASSRLLRAAGVGLTFALVTVGWTLFRETRLDRLVAYAALRPWDASAEDWVAAGVLGVTAGLAALPLVAALLVEPRVARVQGAWRWPLRTVGWTLAVLAIASTVRVSGQDFLYFRF